MTFTLPQAKRKLHAYLELIRVGNSLMAALAVIIGYFIITRDIQIELFIAAISGFFITAGGQAINDYFDHAIDAKKNKSKPIPSGRVAKKEAFLLSLVLFFIGMFLALYLPAESVLIAWLFTVLLLIYAAALNRAKYVGNMVVAAGTAITFAYGAAAAGNITLLVVAFSLTAFLANMAREIIKDFEDMQKDKGHKRTLPMVDTTIAKKLVVFYYFIALFLGAMIFVVFDLSLLYLGLLVVSAVLFAKSTQHLFSKKYTNSQKLAKLGMLASMLAFITVIFL